jgi:hypothetical protein
MITTTRRSFLRMLGIGAAVAPALPQIIQAATTPAPLPTAITAVKEPVNHARFVTQTYSNKLVPNDDWADAFAYTMGSQMALTREMIRCSVLKAG